MTERPSRHLTLVKSGGRVVGRDAISLPAPMPRAPRIHERTLLPPSRAAGRLENGFTSGSAGYRPRPSRKSWSRSFGRKRRRCRRNSRASVQVPAASLAHLVTKLVLAAPASLRSVAVVSHAAVESFSHLVRNDVRAAPESFFSSALALQVSAACTDPAEEETLRRRARSA